jgi:hypothetical protein
LACFSRGTMCVLWVASIWRWIVGCPRLVTVQPIRRKIIRHGRRWEATKRIRAERKAKRKRVEERGSLLKFVGGVRREMILSWRREKSSMLFWRSLMLRKKSRESSLAGFTVGGGAIGGPVVEYWKVAEVWDVIVGGAAGCRAINEGISRARRRTASGRTVKRYGSMQTNVYTARNERVWEVVCQERRRMTFDWKTNTTPIRALKRRKFADIVGREKEGRVI